MEREHVEQTDLDLEARKRERGASLVEYALLLALVAIVCIVAVTAVGTNLNESYDTSRDSIFTP
jgi:pilus assembly protein Flp/PilA